MTECRPPALPSLTPVRSSRTVTIINRLTLPFTALPCPLLRPMFFSGHRRGCDALLTVYLSCNNKITIHCDVNTRGHRSCHTMHRMSTAIPIQKLGACLNNVNDKLERSCCAMSHLIPDYPGSWTRDLVHTCARGTFRYACN
jgi:hypothetical protein